MISSRPKHVFIVDDNLTVRMALTMVIEHAGIAVKSFDCGQAMLDACRPDWAGCIVTDLLMPDMTGLELQEKLNERGVLLPLIFITGHGDIPLSVRAIKAGAVDFLTKPVPVDVLLHSVSSAMDEWDAIASKTALQEDSASHIANLTAREKEVMMLALDGHTNKETARIMGISHRTVEIHKAHLLKKTGAAKTIELLQIAKDCGLMD